MEFFRNKEKFLKCVHFLCGIFVDRNSLPRGSLNQKFDFSHFQCIFSCLCMFFHPK